MCIHLFTNQRLFRGIWARTEHRMWLILSLQKCKNTLSVQQKVICHCIAVVLDFYVQTIAPSIHVRC